jgi:hypothetical protein
MRIVLFYVSPVYTRSFTKVLCLSCHTDWTEHEAIALVPALYLDQEETKRLGQLSFEPRRGASKRPSSKFATVQLGRGQRPNCGGAGRGSDSPCCHPPLPQGQVASL